LELLQIHSLDISTRKVFYMSDERGGILLRIFWEPRDEVLEVRVGPRLAC